MLTHSNTIDIYLFIGVCLIVVVGHAFLLESGHIVELESLSTKWKKIIEYLILFHGVECRARFTLFRLFARVYINKVLLTDCTMIDISI